MTAVHSVSHREARPYNYEHFEPSIYTLDQPAGPQVGERAPDFTAERLSDGAWVRLSDYRGQIVVLETGSATCPMYVQNITAMSPIVTRFTEVAFLVLYTREAHPGERIGPHRSLADKTRRARLITDRDAERRTILVDDLGGTAHQRYGSMPNTLYILEEQGTVVFRSLWNDPAAVARVLQQLQDGQSVASLKTRFRPAAPSTVWRVLRRAGWRAVQDFVLGVPALAIRHARSDLIPPRRPPSTTSR